MAANETTKVRYFERQFLGAADMQADQQYHRDAPRRHDLGPHTWGLIVGFELQEIPVNRVQPNQHQPRAYFDEEALVSLTASVRAMVNNGAIRAFGDGTYGITPECVFPQGVTVVEALDALAVTNAGGAR